MTALAAPPPVSRPVTRTPRLLCIDDDPAISHALRLRLCSHSVDVLHALDGDSGVHLARSEEPDIVLTDWRMQRCGGDEVLSRLRQSQHTRRIPVIVISGLMLPGLKYQALNLGATSFYFKPLAFHKLLKELNSLLNIKNSTMPARPYVGHRSSGSQHCSRRDIARRIIRIETANTPMQHCRIRFA